MHQWTESTNDFNNQEDIEIGESENTLFRIRRNSLDLNSLRADLCKRSINSSPLRSTISSLISSVVFALISFNSSSLFAIITTDNDLGLRVEREQGVEIVGHTCAIRMPLNVEFGLVKRVGLRRKAAVDGGATERVSIVVGLGVRLVWVLQR